MAQTTFLDAMVRGREGGIADGRAVKHVESAAAETALVAGKAVQYSGDPSDPSPRQVSDASAATAIAGVVLYDPMVESASATAEFAVGDVVGVMRKGAVYVVTEDACTPASSVFVRVTAAGAEVAGSFRSDADGGDAIELTTGARFLHSSGAGEINILELDL